jgi:hypothetical protein
MGEEGANVLMVTGEYVVVGETGNQAVPSHCQDSLLTV